LDETFYRSLKMNSQVQLAAGWMIRTTLLLLILALVGCQDQGYSHANIAQTERTPTITPVSTASPYSPGSTVTLALLGDVMLGRDIHPTPETFAYLEHFISITDLALANLESPLTDSPVETKSPYALCGPPDNVHSLEAAGFDLVSIANNHNLDCGTEGLAETELTLTEAGLGFIGPNPEPVYRLIHGIPLAFLAFDATAEQFDLGSAVQAVHSAGENGAIVLVSIHWGVEYHAGASGDQKEIARRLADAGAALIWGHHPHVLQPSAWIHDGKTLVFYSLGNALFDQHGLERTRQSALVLVTLNSTGVVEFRAVPFLIDVQNSRLVSPGEADIRRIREYFR
jgi:gamma-polyglutamate biosynthesis protein CapA